VKSLQKPLYSVAGMLHLDCSHFLQRVGIFFRLPEDGFLPKYQASPLGSLIASPCQALNVGSLLKLFLYLCRHCNDATFIGRLSVGQHLRAIMLGNFMQLSPDCVISSSSSIRVASS
jgi:hypothetical protein